MPLWQEIKSIIKSGIQQSSLQLIRCSWGKIACLFLIVQGHKNMTERNRSISRGNFYSTPSPPIQRDHSSSLDITRSSSSSSSTSLHHQLHYPLATQSLHCNKSSLGLQPVRGLYKIFWISLKGRMKEAMTYLRRWRALLTKSSNTLLRSSSWHWSQ